MDRLLSNQEYPDLKKRATMPIQVSSCNPMVSNMNRSSKARCFLTSLLMTFSTSALAQGECVAHPPVDIPPIGGANPDVELFSDLLAAPNGAPLTVYGTDLSGPLVVGGATMSNCPIINETVFEESLGNIRLGKTTCWLEGLPLGATVVDAGSSNTLPLTIINGSVQTISSFNEFDQAMDNPAPGDIFVLRGFTANLSRDGRMNGGSHLLWMRQGEHDASPLNPIALIGYPNDPATLVADGQSGGNRVISLQNTGWTISNLDFESVWQAVNVEGEARLIGNRILGLTGPRDGSGTGSVRAGGHSRGGLIAGNLISGGRSNFRYDHAIYIQDCPVEQGWTVSWNHIFDNDFARGPQLSINHQSPRCGEGSLNVRVAPHTITSNVIDTTAYRGRCIGISSIGWDPAINPTPPERMYIGNNFLVNCGYWGDELDSFGDERRGVAIYAAPGNAVINGNILYRPDGGIQVGTSATTVPGRSFLPTDVTNNVFIGATADTIRILLHEGTQDLVNIEGNVFQ